MTAVCVLARERLRERPADPSPLELADLYCRGARRRVRALFRALGRNDDALAYRVARGALEDRYAWLERGILDSALASWELEEAAVGARAGEA
jgi:hypothetical protein